MGCGGWWACEATSSCVYVCKHMSSKRDCHLGRVIQNWAHSLSAIPSTLVVSLYRK